MGPSEPVGADALERTVEEVVRELRAAGGDNLLGVALYGSLVKGRHTPGLSDVNLLVVVADADLAALLPLAPVLTGALRRAQVTAFVVTPADLRAAARLFPAKVLDMQLFHRRLYGELHLAELAIDAPLLRYRTAQELKNMQLRLRRLLVERGAETPALWEGVVRSLPKLAVALGTLVRSRGVALPLDREAVLRQAAAELGLPAATMARFAPLRRRDAPPAAAAVEETAREYLAMLGSLAERVGAAGSEDSGSTSGPGSAGGASATNGASSTDSAGGAGTASGVGGAGEAGGVGGTEGAG